jgi:glucokinase
MKILFDIGGTKTRIAKVIDNDTFDIPVVFKTPKNFDEGIILLKDNILKISKGEKITHMAGGIAGLFDQSKGVILSGNNLSGWIGKPIRDELSKIFGAQVFMDNDAALVGLGEAIYGAGRGFDIVAYITVSTGVGGARIVNGEIDERSIGFEPGRQIIDSHGDTLENLVSGTAVLEKTGRRPEEINDPRLWDGLAKVLAYGLNNIVVNWSPSVIVVGGSMMNDVGISIIETEKYLKEALKNFPVIPPLRKASLGDFGGLHGGLVRLKNK